jgi:hypothetical protein
MAKFIRAFFLSVMALLFQAPETVPVSAASARAALTGDPAAKKKARSKKRAGRKTRKGSIRRRERKHHQKPS